MSTQDIVAKLWRLCDVLRDDGITYHQYVTELTYLLFLKMAKETSTEEQIPEGHRWDDLRGKAAPQRLEHYKLTLVHLGAHGSRLVQEIFANASSFIKKPATLSTLVTEIDQYVDTDGGAASVVPHLYALVTQTTRGAVAAFVNRSQVGQEAALGQLRVLQQQRALDITIAVQPGAQPEVSLKERVGGDEKTVDRAARIERTLRHGRTPFSRRPGEPARPAGPALSRGRRQQSRDQKTRTTASVRR